MKKLVWLAAALLGFALAFPNGVNFSNFWPEPEETVVVNAEADSKIVSLLSSATKEDKIRIADVYAGLKEVLGRDKGQRVSTTEKLAELQANTLQLAIPTPGKYPGLDDAIEAVFARTVGEQNLDPTVVNPLTPDLQAKLIAACEIIIASAQ